MPNGLWKMTPLIFFTSVSASVLDPDPLDTDLDPVFHFGTDPDHTFQFDTDSDPTV
jgi:hypothetical protein